MADEPATSDVCEPLRRLIEALARGDVDAAERLFAPHAVFEVVALGTAFEGVSAIRGFYEEWMGAYEQYETEVEELLDLGGGVGFAVLVFDGRPVGSTGHARYRVAQVSTWADGLILRITGYPSADIDEARVAAERLAEERR
jgi:ketosteroid isomerase-like protein